MIAAVAQHPAGLSYALSYALRGWPVFPVHTPDGQGGCSCHGDCGKIGKHPRTEHGLSDATTDEEQIRLWWTRWPDANVAIATGPARLVVADVDPRNGGDVTWSRLATEHDPIDLTPSVVTGSGGTHIYLAAPYGVRVRSVGNALGKGVDVKAEGGYVVAPPSLHESGERYRFRPGADPGETELQRAPSWIVHALRQHSRERGDLLDETDSWALIALEAAGLLGKRLDSGSYLVTCPWRHEHTGGRDGDSSTVILPATTEHPYARFHCSHAHCSGRGPVDLRGALPADAVARADAVYPVPSEAYDESEWLPPDDSSKLPPDPMADVILLHGAHRSPPPPPPREPGDDSDEERRPEPAWIKAGALMLTDMLTEVRLRAETSEPVPRVSACHLKLDQALRGFRRGNAAILGARTSWGKSTYAIMVIDEAIDAGQRVLLVTTEDPPGMYGQRFAARRADVDATSLTEGTASEDELVRIGIVGDKLPRVPTVLPAIGKPVEWIATTIRSLCAEWDYELVILDYLQRTSAAKRTQDRRNEVTYVAGALIDAIRNANAAGLILSQFKRLEKGTKPGMHDLKESGDLENMAEHVIVGWTEAAKNPTFGPGEEAEKHYVDLPKNKDGPKLEHAVCLPFDTRTAAFRRTS